MVCWIKMLYLNGSCSNARVLFYLEAENNITIGIQVLCSGVLWPHPAWVTRLHHLWGAIETEIFVFKFLHWPGFESWTSQSNGHECYHSTITHQKKWYSTKWYRQNIDFVFN